MSVNMPLNPCAGGTTYIIRPGDSLYSLAQRFQTTVDAILAASPGISPTNLQIGQQICIPVSPVPTSCPGGFTHTVVISDTFYSIARSAGISVEALLAANPGVDPNRLQIGQQICVPAPAPPPVPCPGTPYKIQPGDTFIGLARRFGYTLDALLAANPGINPQNLRVGQEICLPPSPGGGPFPCYGGSIYMVQPGDTFFGIAKRFGVPLNKMITANPDVVNPDFIQAGTPICIPR